MDPNPFLSPEQIDDALVNGLGEVGASGGARGARFAGKRLKTHSECRDPTLPVPLADMLDRLNQVFGVDGPDRREADTPLLGYVRMLGVGAGGLNPALVVA